MPFYSTLIVAIADLIDAGPRIARSIPGDWEPVQQWDTLLHDNSPNQTSQQPEKDPVELLQIPSANTSLLLIGSQPSAHQATLLSQAIVDEAKQSNCRNVIVFAASNVTGADKDQPLVARLCQDTDKTNEFALLPPNATLGEHILSTLTVFLHFSQIPSTILVHPAKKGGGWKYNEAITQHLAQALTTIVGNKIQFSCNTTVPSKSFVNDADSLFASAGTPPVRSHASEHASPTPPSVATAAATTSNASDALPDLPDPNKPLDITSTSRDTMKPPLRKKAPLASSTSLAFHYEPSADGVDENLVIFFHGLGDKIAPGFINLAKKLQLPQTATCCIQAPTPVPYLDEEAWQWYPSFDLLTGERKDTKNRSNPATLSLDYSGFSADRIILFGFSQGGSVALDVAAFGGTNLKAIISIGGYLMEESQGVVPKTSPLTTRVFFKYIERMFGKANTALHIVDGMGSGMPNSEAGWRPIMTFFAEVLEHRNVALENMSDVYEVKQ
ncbi:hypothetical protein BGZ73_002763 [Actinomortierella ambigua]|nr:hypothetical protein BGZ73_002763 [Actinomortierella ambigua]